MAIFLSSTENANKGAVEVDMFMETGAQGRPLDLLERNVLCSIHCNCKLYTREEAGVNVEWEMTHRCPESLYKYIICHHIVFMVSNEGS